MIQYKRLIRKLEKKDVKINNMKNYQKYAMRGVQIV